LASATLAAAGLDDPHVWISIGRRGVDYHDVVAATESTTCHRTTRYGEILPRSEAIARYASRPCRRCYPDGDPDAPDGPPGRIHLADFGERIEAYDLPLDNPEASLVGAANKTGRSTWHCEATGATQTVTGKRAARTWLTTNVAPVTNRRPST
jgi:hypothetical protein